MVPSQECRILFLRLSSPCFPASTSLPFLKKFMYLGFAGSLSLGTGFLCYGEQGLLFVVLWRLLTAVASLVVESRLSNCGTHA